MTILGFVDVDALLRAGGISGQRRCERRLREQLTARPVDVILLDVVLLGQDGLTLARPPDSTFCRESLSPR
jgi:DNA-binding response OmpR family regulator